MNRPDTISVEASQSARVEANRADIFLSVAGASIFSGAAALQKAREVAELVAALKTVGVAETQIKIEGIRAENQSGTFSKSSTVHYSLRLEDVPLECIADTFGVITAGKNATLEHLAWKFEDEDSLRDRLRSRCLQMALERATSISQTLRVRLLGVYDTRERWWGTREEISDQHLLTGVANVKMKRAVVSEEELGFAITHAENVKLELTIQFRISEFTN